MRTILLGISMIFLFLLVLIYSCQDVPEITVPHPDSESDDNTLACSQCYNFGKIVELHDDQIVVSEYENVYIYQKIDDKWVLTFENTKQNTSGVQSIRIRDNWMAIGVSNAQGTGWVEIYRFSEGTWELNKTLQINRNQDNFGSAIDIAGDRIIIGANAPWSDEASSYINDDEGRIYIYKFQNGQWSREAEFSASNSTADDRFGTAVGLNGNYAFAGGNGEGLHMYKYNGSEWLLDSLIDMPGVRAIAMYDNKLLVRNVAGYEPQLFAFRIDENGGIVSDTIETDFNGEEISDHGEVIQIYGDMALVDMEEADHCYLLNYSNGMWAERSIIKNDQGIYCEYDGLSISDKYVAIGGNNYLFINDL